MLLPKKLGPVTLMRKLGSDGVSEAFVGILDEPAGQQVVVRRLLPHIVRDPARLAAVETRVQDLTAVRHPVLAPVLRLEQVGDERLILEEYIDTVSLADVIATCRKEGTTLPHNLFLNLATQICMGLEALHGRPGKASGADSVMHLALGPGAVALTPDARLIVGEYGLVRSPTSLPSGGAAEAAATRLAHLSPEQTHPDQKLTPASDIFSLGSLLYELLLLEPLFRRESSLQTIHAVRKAEVSAALQVVKRTLPGLDKVLYRALSLNPRHRYQRAFVMREDIRGLMAGYTFTRVEAETVAFLEPLFAARAAARGEAPLTEGPQDATGALLREAAGVPADTTMGFLKGRGAADLDDDDELEGLEMWSEVPTTVDPTDPSALPVTSTTPEPAPRVARDETTWIRHDGGPPPDAFESDESTDISAPAATPAPSPGRARSDDTGTKRQLSPEEAAALGLPVRPTPEPAPRRAERVGGDTIQPAFTDSGADTIPPADEPEPAATEKAPPGPPPRSEPPAEAEAPRAMTPPPAESAPEPPPREATPAPEPVGPATDEVTMIDDDDVDLDWRPRRNRWVGYAAAGIGVFLVLVLICGGGALGLRALVAEISRPPVIAEVPSLETVPGTPPATPATTEAPTEAETMAEGSAEPAASAAPTEAPAEAPATPEPTPAVARTEPAPSRPTAPAPTTNRSAPSRSTPARTASNRAAPSGTSTPSRTRSAPTTAAPSTNRSRPSTAAASLAPPTRSSSSGSAGELDAAIASSQPEGLTSELDALSDKARSGRLSAADKLTLEMTEPSDLRFTRANTLLYEDAKARGDDSAMRKYLETLLDHPENRYNPTLLAEGAQLDIASRSWDRALERAVTAERYWARLPSELVFSRKAMIYETQAAAWQGKFYESGGADLAALRSAIAGWEKYQRHVASKSRTDLSRIADEQLAKLYDARRRLE